jgi:peroxiredoxin
MRYRDEHASIVAAENIYLPDAYYDFLNEILINDDDAFVHPNYMNFLRLYYPFRLANPDFPHGLASRQQIVRTKENNTPMYMNMECGKEISKANMDQKLLVIEKFSYNALNKSTAVAYRIKVRTQDGRIGWIKAHLLTLENNTALLNAKPLYVNNLEIDYIKDYLDCMVKFDSLGVMGDPNEARRLLYLKKDDRLDVLNQMTDSNVSYNNAGDYYASPFSKVRTPWGLIGWIATAGVQLHFKQKTVSEWQSQIAGISQTPLWGLDYFFYGRPLYFVAGNELREKLLFNGKVILNNSLKYYMSHCKEEDLKEELTNIFKNEDKTYNYDTLLLKKTEVIIDQRTTNLNKRSLPYELAQNDAVSLFLNTSQMVGTSQQENTIASLEKNKTGVVTPTVITKAKPAPKKKSSKAEIFREPQFPEVKYEFKTVSFKGSKKVLDNYKIQISVIPDLVHKTDKNLSYTISKGKKIWLADTFLFKVNLTEPVNGYIKTKNDSFAIWIEPGQRYAILEENGKIKLTGEGANTFGFIEKLRIFNAKTEEETNKNTTLPIGDYKTFLTKKLKEKKDFLIDNNVIKKLPINYYKTIDFDNEYWYYNRLLDYPTKHPEMDLTGYFDFIREIKIQNDRALQSPEYQKFVNKFLEKQIAANADLGLPESEIARMTYSTRVLKYWQATAIAKQVKLSGIDEELLEDIQKYADDSSYPILNESLKTAYHNQSLKKSGYKIPTFQLSNAKNETVKSSDFKNKVVLIHFWSAKNKDYAKEIKTLDDIQKKLNNPSVIFLKINTDKNISDWRKAVKGFKKDKYQLFGNDANTYTQNIYQYFDLNATNATKIIMDKKGNLAQSIKSQFTENELLIAIKNEIAKR